MTHRNNSNQYAGHDPEIEAEILRLAEAMKLTTAELKTFSDRAQRDIKNALNTVDRFDKQGLDGRLRDLEQKLARRPGPSAGGSPNAFRAALGGAGLRDAIDGFQKHGRAAFTVNAAILSGAGGIEPAEERLGVIVGDAQRVLRVRDLMTVTPTSAAAIEFTRETAFNNGADVVSEGATKPETTFAFELVTETARTIAHWTSASRQILDDETRLTGFLDQRMRYGVQIKEDAQILLGDGTGQNLNGLVTQATAFSAPAGIAQDTPADFLGAAIAQLRAADIEPDGIVLHPNDWQKILQTKGNDGHYIIANGPFSTAAPMIFQKPIALTTAMTEDEFLVGRFAVDAELFDRMETVVELFAQDSDNVRKNLVTVRAEERVALAVYRKDGFVTGDFGIIT